MGSTHLLLFCPSTLYYLGINPPKPLLNPKFSSQFRCSFASGPRWDPSPDPFGRDRFGFGSDEEFGFGRRVREKRRSWWSDDDDDDDDEEDDGLGFGIFEQPSAIDWIFRILGAFGWMIPAVIISSLFGTGQNSLIMALVLPLGQTALSLVLDKLWGGPSSSPDSRLRSRSRSRSRPGPRRKPFDGSSRGSQRNKGGARGPMNGSYQSWRASNNSSSAKSNVKSGSKFGGWDELDELNNNASKEEQNQNQVEDESQKPEGGLGMERIQMAKLSKWRKTERPLFMRLLIAVFPFLGSWTRFLF